MSRTDKTRPWGVKCLDDPSWLEADHDHRTAEPCDLPERPTKVANAFGGTETRCTWRATRAFRVRRENGGCCSHCNGQVEHLIECRRSRHTAHVETLSARAFANAGTSVIDDLSDVPDLWGPADEEEIDLAWLTYVRGRLGLPETTLVVGVDEAETEDAPHTLVIVLDNDGTRGLMRFGQPHRDFVAALASREFLIAV